VAEIDARRATDWVSSPSFDTLRARLAAARTIDGAAGRSPAPVPVRTIGAARPIGTTVTEEQQEVE
jgi:hypothetical protein